MTRRRVLDAAPMIGAAAVLLVALALARGGVYGWEESLFRPVNDLPDTLRPFVWVLNQYGTIITIPIATIVALVFRRWRIAVALAISGVVVYVLAKLVKEYVERGRPAALLAAVNERETFVEGSLGFPSGHAAVAATITVIVLAYMGRPWSFVAIALGLAVLVSRTYVGAHLPLDLIGGVAMGVLVAWSAVLFLEGHRGEQARAAAESTVPP